MPHPLSLPIAYLFIAFSHHHHLPPCLVLPCTEGGTALSVKQAILRAHCGRQIRGRRRRCPGPWPMWVPTRSTFVVLRPGSVQTPRLPEDNCEACGHGWIHHRREQPPPAHPPTAQMIRGGHHGTLCGGFYSVGIPNFFPPRPTFLNVLHFSSRMIAGYTPPSAFAPLPCGLTMRIRI